MQLATIQTNNLLKKTIVIRGKKYSNKEVYDPNGHLNSDFYLKELKALYPREATIYEHMRIYSQFKEHYPSISMWFKDKLINRIGRISGEEYRPIQIRLAYRSRWYIYHLCVLGLPLDYEYLFSLRSIPGFARMSKKYNLDYGIPDIKNTLEKMGYSYATFSGLRWVIQRLFMHTQKKHYLELTYSDIKEFEQEHKKYCGSFYLKLFWKHVRCTNVLKIRAGIHMLLLILYIKGVIPEAPKRSYVREDMIDKELKNLKHKNIANVIIRYINQISPIKEKNTVYRVFKNLYWFALWLEKHYPTVSNLNKLNRKIMEKYRDYVCNYISNITGKNYSTSQLCNIVSSLKVFFDECLYFGYRDVPQYKLLFQYDIPKKPRPLPLFIPEHDLPLLMKAAHNLKNVYQRNALILLRWTGARREEIRRLDINALDYYPDGTPKLFIPVGKTNTSRWVPIHKEAEIAFKELLEVRKTAGNLKGLPDRKTGKITDYIFMRKNQMISSQLLFDYSMKKACGAARLLTNNGKHKYTSHQFRHTIGTQMINNGAQLPTIMKMLGHQSLDMTIRYAQIYDETLKKDYLQTINKATVIAGGEYAEQLKKQTLRQDELDWIKANFHKTYLVMGHCFHHTRESICDFADACYFCSKFVTTAEHLPKLQEKYKIELKLINDAKVRGWDKEFERHTNVANKVKKIITDLGGVATI